MKATEGQPFRTTNSATPTAKMPAHRRSVLGFLLGLVFPLGSGWLRWRQHQRQEEADIAEDIAVVRYYLKKHPEILESR